MTAGGNGITKLPSTIPIFTSTIRKTAETTYFKMAGKNEDSEPTCLHSTPTHMLFFCARAL